MLRNGPRQSDLRRAHSTFLETGALESVIGSLVVASGHRGSHVEDLGLAVGVQATVLVKSTEVMLGVE